MTDVKNKNIVIAGAARSGIGIALLLKQKGAIPFVSDIGSIQEKDALKLREAGIAYEDLDHSQKALEGEFLVLSPGVPTTSYLPREYLAAGKDVYSEIEAASWFNHSPIVAVTGSNGKTTVTNWLAHTWKTANRSYLLGGNIGTAFSDVVQESAPEKDALLEVSSFQLDHISTFHPRTSIILNITPDHLDRYDHNFEKYTKSKLRITENQDKSDWFIYNFDDPQLSAHAGNLASVKQSPRLLAYSCDSEVPDNGAFIRNGQLILKFNHEEEPLMQIEELGLSGRHNLGNGMATALAARASEINNEYIRESLRTFEGVAHRLEMVRTVDGVRYVNDSKATNINAVWYALDSFTMPIVLILGGRDKGNNYKELEKQIHNKVHTIISLGEAKKAIKDQLSDIVPTLMEADSMKQAVKMAKKQAKRGEVVLLSPACSSFDMFDNYEHRGDVFKEAVSEL